MTLRFSSYVRCHYVSLGFALLLGFRAAQACSICGCSLSSDWAVQDFQSMLGTTINARFEYYDQTQLWSGTQSVDRSALELPNEREIQQQTLNRSYWLGLDHVFSPHWAVSADLPYYSRYHTTIAPGDTELSTSRANGIGDLRVLGRYQQHSLQRGWTLQFGVKAPTGRTDQTFSEGPQSGQPLDRGLQLGTGSTDLLLGASYFARLAPALGAFAQVLLDQPLTRKDDFKPSTAVNLNVGLRWLNSSRVTPQLQFNARWEGRERGANADTENSGASLVDVSPGVTVELTQTSSAFVFVQVPVFQRVNGYQLEPHWVLSTGIRWRL